MALKNIGRYQVKQEIERGGMSVVYLARDPRMEREVAIKMLPRDLGSQTAVRKRFEREARTIAQLEHPCIVPIYDVGEEDRQPYIVMRFMQGGSLADKLMNRLSLAEATKIAARVASALDAAHAKGVIHRDLKPGNILFDGYADAFLSDFGIVKLTDAAATAKTSNATGSIVLGTPAYMSPEQAQGKPMDHRTDVYSLGAVMYEMLTGMPPYTGPTGMSVAMKHVLEPVPSPISKRNDLPAEIDSVVGKAMAKNREDRYASAGEFAEALNQVVRQYPQQAALEPEPMDFAREDIAADATDTDGEGLMVQPAQPEPMTQSGARKQFVPALLVAVGLALLGLIGTLFLTGQLGGGTAQTATATSAKPALDIQPTNTVLPAVTAPPAVNPEPSPLPAAATATPQPLRPISEGIRVRTGNVRSSPSVSANKIADPGDAVAMAQTELDGFVWYEVRLDNGFNGWVRGDVVTAINGTEQERLSELPRANKVPPTPNIPTVVVFAATNTPAPSSSSTPAFALTPTPTITALPSYTPSPTLPPLTPTPTPTIIPG